MSQTGTMGSKAEFSTKGDEIQSRPRFASRQLCRPADVPTIDSVAAATTRSH